LDCDPATDPGVSTDIICDGGTIITCTNGTIHSDGSCHFDGDQVGTLFTDTSGNQVVLNPATFDVSCAGALGGATITCTAKTTDGDVDCDKTKIVMFDCPGDNFCDADDLADCDGITECCDDLSVLTDEQQECNTGSCDRGTQECVYTAANDDGVCQNNTPGDTQSGRCVTDTTTDRGTCEDFGCTDNASCDDQTDNDCTAPRDAGTCDTGAGECTNDALIACTDDDNCNACQANGDCLPEDDEDEGTPCDGGAGQCDGAGVCDDNCDGVDCADDDPCTTDACTPTATCDLSGGSPGTCSEDQSDCTTDADCLCTNTAAADDTPCAPPDPDDPNTCQGACGTCQSGTCEEKPLTCDPVNRDVVACQTRELVAIDCYLLGSGAPLILDPIITPVPDPGAPPSFAGVPYAVVPLLALNLPASLVCGFQSVVPAADVYNSFSNLSVTGGQINGLCGRDFANFCPDLLTPCTSDADCANLFDLDSWLPGTTAPIQPTDPFLSPHQKQFFDFAVGCGNAPGTCSGGTCTSDDVTECVFDNDCIGTGPGVVVPFVSGRPLGPTDPPGFVTITTPTPGAVLFSYTFDSLAAYVEVPALAATLCLGGSTSVDGSPTDACSFICAAADRTGDSSPTVGRGLLPGATDAFGDPLPGLPPINPLDSPRVMIDGTCDKIGVAACGGTKCVTSADCPLVLAGQTCDTGLGICNPVNFGFCGGGPLPDPVAGTCTVPSGDPCFVDQDCKTSLGGVCNAAVQGACATDAGTTLCLIDDDCPSPPVTGFPVCCEPFFDISGAANVCATGQPGSALAETEAPCSGQSDLTTSAGRRCEGVDTCGDCPQVTGPAPTSVYPVQQDWPIVSQCSSALGNGFGKCAGTGGTQTGDPCPNGDSDCIDSNGNGVGSAGEDYCVVPCADSV
jgi:hypothetical protein